ncbi:divergent polysaccharide deacetylase family protein [Hydrogenimonas sp.]|uniref:divergent polysaccharide deacetylase family protein n=1 Tax=Hydrogenimonas sp. TaxID=2231112 RepID=UPI00261512A2|nr:divergent polysaccharide deacetylase family protein [Hydrogenimonas sp.]
MAKQKHPHRNTKRTPRKRKKQTFSTRFKIYLIGGTIVVSIVAILMGLAGWIGYEMGKEQASKRYHSTVTHYQRDIEKLRKKLKLPPASGTPKIHPKRSPDKAENLSEIKDYVQAGGKESSRPAVKEGVRLKHPKLAIIIDDVAFASQVKTIRALPWAITPSIFPPTSRHPDTPKLAAKLDHYMIHLPMEAMHYNNPEDGTLTTESSNAEIDLRIRKLRHWFPQAHFINNHTGSKFTADMASMERFFPIAKRYGFVFIDSRTTPKTVVPRICKEYHDPYIARDVFLDNNPDIDYIQNQLKKAVRIAKSQGYAIAIGHPHASTLKALADSKSILKGIDVVYIDELYEKIR